MLARTKSIIAAAALVAAPVAVVVTATIPAEAAGKYYSSCDNLHKDFKHGVAKNSRSAAKQVRDGYGRPATGRKAKAAYNANYTRLDRDRDGTACEA